MMNVINCCSFIVGSGVEYYNLVPLQVLVGRILPPFDLNGSSLIVVLQYHLDHIQLIYYVLLQMNDFCYDFILFGWAISFGS